jgi:hypothetical protein
MLLLLEVVVLVLVALLPRGRTEQGGGQLKGDVVNANLIAPTA